MKVTEIIYFGFELNLLEAHLHQHQGLMDHTIVVECGHTTTGVPKPLLFEENKARFDKYNVEHIILPDETYPIETKTFLEFKHQDPNGKNIIHPYASFDADWVFHNDTDEIIGTIEWNIGKVRMNTFTEEVQCVHHHLDQRSPYVNALYGKFHVHRIFRAGAKIPAPKSVKRMELIEDGDQRMAGWHFTNCFSNPEEIYWKIKTRNWLVKEQSMEFCKEIFEAFHREKLGYSDFDDVRFMFPLGQKEGWCSNWEGSNLPKFIKQNRSMFPVSVTS